MPAKSPRKIIEDAIKLLNGGKNWIQGALHETVDAPDGPQEFYCILGAINKAGGPLASRRRAKQAVARHIKTTVPSYEDLVDQKIALFNDSEAKSAKDVIAVLKRAARSLLRKITPKNKQKDKSQYYYAPKKQKEKAYIGG